MPDPLKIIAFFEDFAHESFIKPLIARVGRENSAFCEVKVISGKGGHGRVLQELKLFKAGLQSGNIQIPDIIVIAKDANCRGPTKARTEIVALLPAPIIDRAVIACPDPHIEKWFFADQVAFETAIGSFPTIKTNKCRRDYYKAALAGAVVEAGYPRTFGGAEFAEAIVEKLDIYRASKNDSSLAHFIRDLRARLA